MPTFQGEFCPSNKVIPFALHAMRENQDMSHDQLALALQTVLESVQRDGESYAVAALRFRAYLDVRRLEIRSVS